MKRLLFLLLFSVCLLHKLQAQTILPWDWQQNTHVSYADLEFKNNFIYAAGNFTDSAVTLGGNTYVNAGGSDIIICKMDTLGNVIWSQHVGSSYDEKLNSICVDDSDHVLVVGSMEGNLNVGSLTLTSNGGRDMLLIKYSSNGAVLLAKQTGSLGNDEATDITTDYNNDIYLVGNKDTNNIIFAGTNNNYRNAILKFSSGGNELFMNYMRGDGLNPAATGSTSLIKYSAFDSTIIISGRVTTGFSTAAPYCLSNTSNLNLQVCLYASASWGAVSGIYFCKTDLNGMAQKMGSVSYPYLLMLYDLTINPLNGDFYFTQRSHAPMSQNDYNHWIKADANLSNFVTLTLPLSAYVAFGGNNIYLGAPLKINYYNNSLYGLLFQQHLNSTSFCTDYYAVKYDLNTSAYEIKNLDYGQTYTSCVGYNGTFCLGSTNTMAKSCPGNCAVPSYSLHAAPDVLYCIGKTDTIGYPECYYVKGGTPPYTFNWSPAVGLSNTSIPQPLVSGLMSNTTYTLMVTDSLNNVLYDTVEIMVNAPTSSNTYVSICANQMPYVWHMYSLYSSGNYTYINTGVNGCDSIEHLILTILPLPTPTITWNGMVLQTQSNYTSYQWFKDGVIISGAVDSFYTTSLPGNYTVEVTDSNGCINTSAIYNTSAVTFNEANSEWASVYPNPTTSMLSIQLTEKQKYKFIVLDMNGRKVLEKQSEGPTDKETLNLSHLAKGMYSLRIIGDTKKCTKKISKF